MRFAAILLSVLAIFAFTGQAHADRRAVLVDPAPVTVPAGMADAAVAKEIKRTLLSRGWTIAAETPGQMDAELHLREHVAKIRITYDTKSVTFTYVDSTNLDYKVKDGTRWIHANYLNWIRFLTTDLNINLQLAQI